MPGKIPVQSDMTGELKNNAEIFRFKIGPAQARGIGAHRQRHRKLLASQELSSVMRPIPGPRRAGALRSALSPQKLGDGFGSRADLKFFVNAPDISVDGFVADAEFLGDFLVQKPLAEAIQHFLLTLG